jgi:hypothetical protein
MGEPSASPSYGQILTESYPRPANLTKAIRLGYVIFVHDDTIHSMTPANTDLETLDLPLPAPSSLWLAESAAEWSYQVENARTLPRKSHLLTFHSAVELLIANGNKPCRREALKIFSSDAFTLQILIHGVASAILKHKLPGVCLRGSSQAWQLQLPHFEDGLRSLMACFSQLPDTELLTSALVTYHFTSILLRNSLSDILTAAGTACRKPFRRLRAMGLKGRGDIMHLRF